MKNKFLQEMKSRGYIHQCTNIDKLAEICNKQSIYGYIGFDCTANSLHVGSLLQIMILKLMQKHGHRPIILLGGGTTLIGDPSGKDATRKILKKEKLKFGEKITNFLCEKLVRKKNHTNTLPRVYNRSTDLSLMNHVIFCRKTHHYPIMPSMLNRRPVRFCHSI